MESKKKKKSIKALVCLLTIAQFDGKIPRSRIFFVSFFTVQFLWSMRKGEIIVKARH